LEEERILLGKLTQLSQLEKSFIVPKGIVVTTSAYEEFLTPEIHEAVKYLENIAYGNKEGDLQEACNKVSNIVEKTLLPKKICHSINEDLKDLFGDEVNQCRFAVRSSATGEDTAAMSAAGQMDTFLGIQGMKEIFAAVKKCWASQFGHIAVEYKADGFGNGFNECKHSELSLTAKRNGQVLNSPMAVVIQEMVACEVSGVLFTCDPVTNNPSVITITANFGLGETVVSGSVEPDTIKLKRTNNGKLEIEEVVIGSKHQRIIMQESGGTTTEDIDEYSRNESCLSKETAQRLGKLSLKIEKYYKSSRDIEWGILNDEIYILQSRPVTNVAAETDNEIKHEFDAPLRCENEYYSVANVGEVMPGATSPLGIDLVIKCFSNILKRSAKEKGVPDNFLQSKYYSTGLLPFYNHVMITVAELMTRYGLDTAASKGFMISIFGRIIDDPDIVEYASSKCGGEDPGQSLMFNLKFYWDLFSYDFGYKKVKKYLDNYHLNYLNTDTAEDCFAALMKSGSDFDKGIEQHFEGTESSSTWNMYLFRILCHAHGRFDTDVYSDFSSLLATSSNVESANVPHAMQEVAFQIVKDISPEEFRSMSIEEAEEWLQTTTCLSGYKFRQFLKRHGHRCLKEFDVRSITWEMDAKILIKLLQSLALGVSKEELRNKMMTSVKYFRNFMCL
ncbi:probable phosphoenolpyruvate synthase, partial [Caerostris extrusa]